jgi:hypothetical protein
MTSVRLLIGTALVGLVAGCGAATVNIPAAATAAPTAATTAVPTAAATAASTIPTAVPTPVPPTPVPTAVPPTPKPTPVVTTGDANAAGAAANYLSEGSGWSKVGLIAQLDSSFGDGYTVAQATYGVDSQGANWDAQAVLCAKGYLSTGSFSRAGLIAQLDSSYGNQFTYAQAVYGVTGAGL